MCDLRWASGCGRVTAQTRSEVKALLERHGLSPRKALGQHFLADRNITTKIVAVSGVGPSDRVVEIGPGTGSLTVALAEMGTRVLALEVDTALEPVLTEVTSRYPNVEVRYGDAMKVDLAAELDGAGWVMVANLPYNVGTPLVLDALRHVPQIERFVIMVQVEVARRFAAVPGTKEYGLPSIVCQLHADTSLAFTVPPQVFVPAPRVGSAVVVLQRRPVAELSEAAIELAASAFNQRRKMLRSSLAGVVDRPEAVAASAGIDPRRRAEELTAADYVKLAEVWRG